MNFLIALQMSFRRKKLRYLLQWRDKSVVGVTCFKFLITCFSMKTRQAFPHSTLWRECITKKKIREINSDFFTSQISALFIDFLAIKTEPCSKASQTFLSINARCNRAPNKTCYLQPFTFIIKSSECIFTVIYRFVGINKDRQYKILYYFYRIMIGKQAVFNDLYITLRLHFFLLACEDQLDGWIG